MLFSNQGNIELDRAAFTVKRGGEEVKLVPKEFALLEFLMRNPGTVFAPEALLNRVWPKRVGCHSGCTHHLHKTPSQKLDAEGRQNH